MGWVGWDLCAGLFYEHRFAMLITIFIFNITIIMATSQPVNLEQSVILIGSICLRFLAVATWNELYQIQKGAVGARRGGFPVSSLVLSGSATHLLFKSGGDHGATSIFDMLF